MTLTAPFGTASHAELGLMQGCPPPPDKRVTKHNGLWEAPYNRWSYQNMRRLWPTAPIRPCAAPAPVQRGTDPGIAQMQIAREDGSMADFDTFLRQSFTDSFVVLQKDRIIFERHLNGMTAHSPHIMFSCTKSFIGLLALMAIDEGLVQESTKLGDILPELPTDSPMASVSFGQVMDMTAAFRFDETYDDPDAEIHDYAAVLGMGGVEDDRCIHDYVAALKRDDGRAHGHAFHYQTPQTDMLNWALNRLTGQDFIKLLEDRIWHPMGGADDAYVMLDPIGTLFAGGGLNAGPEDMARFAMLILNNGRAGDHHAFPASLIDTLSAGGDRQAFLRGPSAEAEMANGTWSYRAQWWVRGTPGCEAIIALGIYGQWIYIDRARGVAIIRLASQPEADSWSYDTFMLNACDAIVRCVAGG